VRPRHWCEGDLCAQGLRSHVWWCRHWGFFGVYDMFMYTLDSSTFSSWTYLNPRILNHEFSLESLALRRSCGWSYILGLQLWRRPSAWTRHLGLGLQIGFFNKKKLRESLLTPPVAWTFLFKLKGCASTLHLHFILVSLNLAKALPEMIRPKLSATGSVQIVVAIESKAVDSIEIPQNLRAF